MRITGSSVGIGTTSPATSLQVNGTARATRINSTGGVVDFDAATGNNFISVSSGNMSIANNGTVNVYVSGSGNVGIGTTSPISKFHVYGASTTFATIEANGGDYSYLRLIASGSGNGYIIKNIATGNSMLDKALYLYNDPGPIQFVPNGTPANAVTIDTSGNLGIGTATPSSKLTVYDDTAGDVNFIKLYHATNYGATLGVNTNTTGDFFIQTVIAGTGTKRLTIQRADGNVGIGTSLATARLHVSGTAGGIFEVDGAAAVTALYVSASGNVGIGITTPAFSLDVSGVIRSTTSTNISGLILRNTTAGSYTQMAFDGDNADAYLFKGNSTYSSYGGANSFNIYNEGPLAFHSSTTSNIMFMTAAGNVGIGVTSPLAKLTVYVGSGTISGTNDSIRLQVSAYATTARNTIVWGQDGSNLVLARYGLEWNSSTGNMNFVWRDVYGNNATGSTELMRLQGDGNVGIGSTSPGAKLDVVGVIKSNSGIIGGTYLEFTSGVSNSPYTNSSWIRAASGTGMFLVNNDITKWAGFKSNNDFDINGGAFFISGSTGNVGIGTTSPGQLLQVNGGSLLVNTGTSAAAYRDIMIGGIGGWVSGESHGIDTVYGGAASPTTFTRIESYFDGTMASMYFRNFFNASAAQTSILMTIAGNGNVGIGTTSMDTKLHVYNGSAGSISSYESTGITIENSGRGALQFLTPANSDAYMFFGAPHASGLTANRAYVGYNHASDIMLFFSSGKYSFTSGNVGIGTTNPTSSLHVKSLGNGYSAYVGEGGTTAASILPYDGEIYISAGTYYEGSVWRYKQASGASLFMISETTGVNWFNGTGSSYDNVVSNVKLWNQNGYWKNIVQSNQSGNSYFTGGNVGIGTTSPSYKFHVSAPNSASYFDGGTTDTSFYISHGGYNPGSQTIAGIRTNTGSPVFNAKNGGTIYFNRDVAAADVAFQYNSGGNTSLFISGSGNVGIGTSSPTHNLEIAYAGSAYLKLNADFGIGYFGMESADDSMRFVTAQSTPIHFYTNNDLKMIIASGGNVGIGTTSPRKELDVNGNNLCVVAGQLILGEDAYSASANYIGLKTSYQSGANDYMILSGKADGNTYVSAKDGSGVEIRGGGNNSTNQITIPDDTYILATTSAFRVTGDVIAYYSSDKRLKDNLTLITDAVSKVSKLSGYSFDWNDKQDVYKGRDYGVVAQEVEEILPELVITRDNGYKAVKYEKLTALLIEAIKEQQQQIDELKYLLQTINK